MSLRDFNSPGVQFVGGFFMGVALLAKVAVTVVELRQPEQYEMAMDDWDDANDLGDAIKEILEGAKQRQSGEVAEERAAEEIDEYKPEFGAEDVVGWEPEGLDGNGPPTEPERSLDIGGPQVEAEIAEIKKLQQEQEIERAELAGNIENYREHLTEQYADSPDEMQQQLDRFEEAAKEAQDALAAQQAADLQSLQEQQQLAQQQLHQQQLAQQFLAQPPLEL